MSAFWVIGIIANLVLTGLAVYWVFKQMKPNKKQAEIANAKGDQTPLTQQAPEEAESRANRR